MTVFTGILVDKCNNTYRYVVGKQDEIFLLKFSVYINFQTIFGCKDATVFMDK